MKPERQSDESARIDKEILADRKGKLETHEFMRGDQACLRGTVLPMDGLLEDDSQCEELENEYGI